MKSFYSVSFVLLLAASCVFGCGSNKAEGGDIPATALTEAEALGRAQTHYGGEWNRIPAQDRELIVHHFGGDEASAQQAVSTAARISKMGAPSAGSPPSMQATAVGQPR